MRIKGSGSDLKSMERWQFPRLELEKVLPVFEREQMSDEDMVDYLDRCVLDPNSPRPSIETLCYMPSCPFIAWPTPMRTPWWA